ncbi:MAG: DUF2344 domain-containing protein, partial [Deltaproteobacteria bacterium]|nr:DUF2344 domain-containing protein [Deltaproteobacteria bacterium]
AALAWDHLAVADKDFLLTERAKALAGQATPDCREAGCQGCGVCDLEVVQPVMAAGQRLAPGPAGPSRAQPRRLSFSYQKLGPARFLGHLEMAQVFYRAFRRAGVSLAYSRGFHPQPKVSFLDALPVGAESLDEWAEAEVMDLRPPARIQKALNAKLPQGLKVSTMAPCQARQRPRAALYRVSLDQEQGQAPRPGLDPARLKAFLAAQEAPYERRRPGKVQRFDLRRPVEEMNLVYEGEVELVLSQTQEGPLAKAEEVVRFVFGLEEARLRVLKIKTFLEDK